ncbi:proprotein convertase P-domain-containing protein [Tahibacter sp.]|uniref:proprotein convertase P-domain-containing protein n=1 Tax=Tahibacter sp. TaxID=2056211 RepID=UPI0028C37AAD|nr:proprotein convertase P-domain-containing protein [Tahibacter sp.]
MRPISAIRASVLLASVFVTLLCGIASADTPAYTVEAANVSRSDRGPATVPDKTGFNAALNRGSAAPQAWTSSQYPIEVEPNGTFATATPLSGAASAREGNIYVNGDIDFWSFTAAAGDRVYAATMTSLSGNASVDSTLQLIGTDGTTVIETDTDDGTFGATSSTIAGATLPAAGTYYLRVSHAVATSQLRPYRLFFQLRSGTPTAETEPNDTFPGQALPAGGWVSGNTSATTDADFYSLNLNAGDTVFISADLDPERDTTEWNAQVGLGSFGVPPLVLVANDAGTATPDSEAFFTTVNAAGTYGVFVGVPTGGTTFGTYHLNVTVFPKVDDGVNCTTYTSTNVPVTIADGPSIQTSTLTIPGNPRIEDLDVEINLTHNFMADLDVQLTAPGGNTVGLFSDIGSVTVGAQTTMNTTFDDEAAIPSLFTVINGNRVAPELNYRLSWFDGQPAGGTWTLTMRDDATGDGGTLNGWSLRVCEVPPPPACAPGFEPVTVLSTDFESGAAGFTHSGTLDEWELGNPTFAPVTGCNSGTNCWKTDLDNTYDASSNQELLSPAINLAGLSPPVVVNWAHKYQLEAAQFDTFAVELRPVGVPASAVNLFQHLGADMQENVGNPAVVVAEAAGWGQVRARADALAGQNVEFAVRMNSDTTVQRAGVAIDDFSITACRVAEADLAITKTDGVTTATPGGSVTYTITASNAGPATATGATVADTFPAPLTCTWTCVGAGGGTCTAAGSGNINDAVNLPSGGSVTYTASCAISPSAAGTLTNTATVTAPASVTDPTPGNNSASDSDTLTPSADLSITKTDGVTTATPGGSTTYTITTSNAGPSNVVSVNVDDTFPASLTCTWTCAGTGGGTCTASGSGNILTPVNLPAGASVTHTATCAISSSATGTLTNTATVFVPAGATDPAPGNNTATDTDTLTPSADLSITKTDGVTTVFPGSSTTYTITTSNAGPSNVTGATVTDNFPSPLISCGWTCTGAGGGACPASGVGNINSTVNLPAGGSVTHSATCTVAPSASIFDPISNTATVTAPGGVSDPTPGNNSATDSTGVQASSDLIVSKTDNATMVAAGGTLTYLINVFNAGPSNTTTTISDTFPAGLTCNWVCSGSLPCTPASGSGSFAIPAGIATDTSVIISATCSVSSGLAPGTVITNTATAPSLLGVDPNPANNSATDTTTVIAAGDLSITKTDGVATVVAGGSTTYTIVARNGGPSSATGATVADTFPAALTCTWTCSGTGGATCTAAGSGNISDTVNLPGGGIATYTAACSVSGTASGSIVNTATVTAPASFTDPNPANNSATDTDGVGSAADLSITKTDGVSNVTPGGSTTYTIVASNAGPSTASGVSVTDTFPAGLTCTWSCTAAGGGSCTAAGAGNIADVIILPTGGSATYTAVCAIATSVSGTLANTATVSSAVTDPDPANNSATDTDTVDPSADLTISKTDGVAAVAPGGTLSYVIVVGNDGPSPVTAATVSDTFPANCVSVTWTCASTGGGTCPASGSGNIAASVDLPAAATATFTALCSVDAASLNGVVISNTASITAPGGVIELDPADNSATDTTTVNATGAIVTATKTVSGSQAQGRDVSYTIVLTNSGTAQNDNPGDEFADLLPPQLTLVSATASSGTALANVGTNSVTWNGAIAAGGSVTITIAAQVSISATGSVSNQGTVNYDGDADGTNESTSLTDDPSVSGAGNATVFGIQLIVPVPGLTLPGLLLLALGLWFIAARTRRVMRR